jgi:hypothetical protein
MQQAAALARGKLSPDDAHPSVQAFADLRSFGQLPYAGGTYEQPALLMRDLRLIAFAHEKEEGVIAKEEREKARRKSSRKRP